MLRTINKALSPFLMFLLACVAALAMAGPADAAETMGLADGTYYIDVAMEGGSGKASVETPALLEIEGGKAYVTLVWSSPNYDYMIVGEEKVVPFTTDPTSQFRVPVLAFDEKYEMPADTTAMGAPHEIVYTFYLDSSTIEEAPAAMVEPTPEDERPGILLSITIGSVVVTALAISIMVGILFRYRQKRF